jgi:hypothetical protein
VVLEVLHCFFVRLCRASRGERPKIPPLSGLGILFPRIQAIFTRFHFSNHMKISADRFGLSRWPHLLRRRVRLAFTAAL